MKQLVTIANAFLLEIEVNKRPERTNHDTSYIYCALFVWNNCLAIQKNLLRYNYENTLSLVWKAKSYRSDGEICNKMISHNQNIPIHQQKHCTHQKQYYEVVQGRDQPN